MASGEQRTGGNYSAEEIKTEVRNTIKQLSEMTRTEADFDQFCQTVLNRVVTLTGAHGALLWQVNGNQGPAITHKAASDSASLISPNAGQHSRVVMEVIGNEKSLGLTSESLEANGESAATDSSASGTPYLMLFSPIYNRNKQCCGSLELLQRNEVTKSAQEGYLRFLTQIAQLFPRWHEQQDLQRLSKSESSWTNQLEYISEVHGSLSLKETSYSIANEARRLLASDRASVAYWNGSKCKITAISSQDRFDNRANVVRKLGYVATASVSADTPFWIIGDTGGIAPEVADKINDYLDESHCRTLIVIPLANRPPETPDLDMNSRSRKKVKKLGALILEYFDRDVQEAEIHETKELVVSQAQLAFENSRKHSEIFMLPLWEGMGRMQKWLFRDHFAKTMTGLVALGLFALALIFYQSPLKMRVDGVLHPAVRKNIYSKADGTISVVHVEDNATVAAGDPLLEIKDPNLDLELAKISAAIESARTGLESTKKIARANPPGRTQEESVSLSGRQKEFETQIKNLLNQEKLLLEQQQFLRIASPIGGQVATWEANRRLTELPVKYNQFIMSIVDSSGPWELELKIPEGKLGYVTQAMEESDEPLEVEFILGLDANSSFTGKLLRISGRAEVSEAGTREFRAIVQADLSDVDPRDLRPGAGATAKIVCGREALGFVWFYQVYDYLRTKIFF